MMAASKSANVGIRHFRKATSKSIWLSFVFLAVIALVMRGTLLPKLNEDAPASFAIWLLSAALLAFGFIRALFEAQMLKREWAALDMLDGDQARISSLYPETITAHRRGAVLQAVEEKRVEREFRQSSRSLASSALAGVGSITRFGSSALLVMAVLGTFAGMKSAMPGLVDAINASGLQDDTRSAPAVSSDSRGSGGLAAGAVSAGAKQGTGSVTGAPRSAMGTIVKSNGDIGGSLTMISEAFGSNFLALFGSLLLGLLAFGAALERRDFLTCLEVTSERRLYRQLPTNADATELERAIGELQRSVAAVAQIGYAVDRLGSGISDLRGMLRETMSDMHSAFSSTVQQHAVRTQQHMNDAVGQLVSTLGTTSQALDATAVSYQGLVRGLEERDLGMRKAADALAEHARELVAMQERSAQSVTQSAEATVTASKALAQVTAIADTSIAVFVRGADDIAAAVGTQAVQLDKAIELLGSVEQRNRASSGVLDVISAQIREHLAGAPAAQRERDEARRGELREMLTRQAEEHRESSHALGMVLSGHADKAADTTAQGLTAILTSLSELGQIGRSTGGVVDTLSARVQEHLAEMPVVEQERHVTLLRELRDMTSSVSEEYRESSHSLGMVLSGHADKTAGVISQGLTAAVASVTEAREVSAQNRADAVRLLIQTVKSGIEERNTHDSERLDQAVQTLTTAIHRASEQSAAAAQETTAAVVSTAETMTRVPVQSADRNLALMASQPERRMASENGSGLQIESGSIEARLGSGA